MVAVASGYIAASDELVIVTLICVLALLAILFRPPPTGRA